MAARAPDIALARAKCCQGPHTFQLFQIKRDLYEIVWINGVMGLEEKIVEPPGLRVFGTLRPVMLSK